jgi:hypothetical protein
VNVILDGDAHMKKSLFNTIILTLLVGISPPAFGDLAPEPKLLDPCHDKNNGDRCDRWYESRRYCEWELEAVPASLQRRRMRTGNCQIVERSAETIQLRCLVCLESKKEHQGNKE